MGMSNAERQRRFRERRDADPERRQIYLQKGRERYRNDCKSGKVKPVEQLSDRDKRAIRKRWRTQKRKDRLRQKKNMETLKTLNTPPSTPEHENPSSRQKKQHKKKSRREEAKLYREKKKMELEIEKLKKKVEMYKKRLARKQSEDEKKQQDTPRRRTRKLLRNLAPKEVKKSLFSYQVLIEALRQKYKEKRKREKTEFATILCNQTLKKYRIKSETYKLIGQNLRRKRSKTGYNSLTKRVSEKVHAFYTRNDNSRLITGKKQTKTHKKIRKQRRVLLLNLKTLHKKFLSEGKTNVSYSVFCRLRPFYVVFPRQSDRNTCLRKTCNNTELLAEALTRAKATKSVDLNSYVEEAVCNINKKTCMYGECSVCKNKSVEVNKAVLDIDVTWFEWTTKRDVRKIKKAKTMIEKPVYVTVKECKEGKVDQLFDRFSDQLKRYQKHIYRTNTQYDYYSMRRKTLSENECIMRIDFSENYVCGYSEEIQSVHFGASKKQISLQTGVTYMNKSCRRTATLDYSTALSTE
ncbi:uncharacterized protein LOC128557639 [Mercenaria mercenaria]|uniref:uncharacterized protein LOC128557639 n=1 Tax=Mercenaria mercenaria TaxID=6596 RepID=UPI00234EC386|nr:uncharacterized protein LOC128557639 [Mercenaria mercenaria]